MPPDRLLNTVLQHYQSVHDAAKTEQIIGTTVHLLTQLSNPLNLGVLTSQLLTAPAIWQRNEGLRTSLRIISIYNTAATRIRTLEAENRQRRDRTDWSGLRSEPWARAVVKGADDRSRRWHHLLVLTGVLNGLQGGGKGGIWNTLQEAVVTAANLALDTHLEDGPLAAASIVLALNIAFPLLSDFHKAQINCNALLPIAVWCVTGEHGFHDGQFLEAINHETFKAPGGAITWPAQAHSFQTLQEMDRGPLVGSMGPLSKLVAFAAQTATDTGVVLRAQDELLAFTGRLLDHWQQNKFSDIDPSLQDSALSPETLQATWPILWAFLKKLMFGVVATLQAIVARSLLDSRMFNETVASDIASKSLHILRNLYFITCRDGNGSFQAYSFSYLTSIDILARSPTTCEFYLRNSRPIDLDTLPQTHLQKVLDLYYLNVAEHLPLALSTEACDALIIRPAVAYLGHTGPMTPAMIELFESAHSAVLSVLACPQHSQLTIKMAPFYIMNLFESFPERISPRQFRVAFKMVMQIVSPPFPISAMEPHLSETLLEMLRDYITRASTEVLPTTVRSSDEPLSAQSSLTLALVDSLPFLPLPLVEEWLTIAAQSMNDIADPRLREPVKKRFWDILVSGEMDVERAAIGVAWWGSKGGRELVLLGGIPQPPLMSGAIMRDDQSSRL